ncbi:MAG: hypothetical protein K1X92_18515 [Bacteroidia bacterium]|nr:hypothetical protein [Bacteroidia bacterium]
MKNQLIICLISLFWLAGCSEQSPNKGEVSVLKDDIPWKVKIWADKENDRFNVALTKEVEACILAQLSIHDIPNQVGVYPLVYNPSATGIHIPTAIYHTLDCDVLLKRYETKDSTAFDNFIEVTKVRRNCIAGRFEVMLNFEGNENDTIRFTEGVFETRTIR